MGERNAILDPLDCRLGFLPSCYISPSVTIPLTVTVRVKGCMLAVDRFNLNEIIGDCPIQQLHLQTFEVGTVVCLEYQFATIRLIICNFLSRKRTCWMTDILPVIKKISCHLPCTVFLYIASMLFYPRQILSKLALRNSISVLLVGSRSDKSLLRVSLSSKV